MLTFVIVFADSYILGLLKAAWDPVPSSVVHAMEDFLFDNIEWFRHFIETHLDFGRGCLDYRCWLHEKKKSAIVLYSASAFP